MSSPDIAGILEHSKELDRLRKEQEEVLVDINKMHKKLQASESLFNSLTRKEENPETMGQFDGLSLSLGTLD
jgi:hypothetical protein